MRMISQKRKQENEIKKLEKTITLIEEEINQLTDLLHSEDVFNDYKKYNDISKQLNDKENELGAKIEEWELLQM